MDILEILLAVGNNTVSISPDKAGPIRFSSKGTILNCSLALMRTKISGRSVVAVSARILTGQHKNTSIHTTNYNVRSSKYMYLRQTARGPNHLSSVQVISVQTVS